MTDRRPILVAVSALVVAGTTGAVRLMSIEGPVSWDPAAVGRWYGRHGAAFIGGRAVLVAVGAIAVVAFAASLRELTWATIPRLAWSGTVMVLAALGYAALASAAAAVDLTVVRALETGAGSAEMVSLAAFAHESLIAVATPALVVVLLGTIFPLLRWGRVGQLLAVAAGFCSLALSLPPTHRAGQLAVPVWFLLAAFLMFVPHASADPQRVARPEGDDVGSRPPLEEL